MKRAFIIALCLIMFFVSHVFAKEILKLATTTSTYETGVLDYILAPFEERNNVTVHIISVGTGKAIKLGENGDVDVILVHARGAENRFVAEGHGVNRQSVMYNDFVILGPQDDPQGLDGLQDVKEALRRIYHAKYTFVSRGDDSGTNKKERYLWATAGLNPRGPWYLETGQGMSATLRVADEKNAYVLLDRATYIFNRDKIRLKKLVEADGDLLNPYGVIAINPHRHPHTNYKFSLALIEWLTSAECQRMICEYKIGGNQLFYVNSKN
ncbi:substrate-binding domain-containing protein [Candidatus Omnitrophota bacterium]